MPRKQALQVNIPNPCSENWDNMMPNEQGRHCGSCNKTIIDFSLYTDKEIANFLKHTPHGCGRFDPHQLNRPITIPADSNTPFLQRALLGAALAVGITSGVQGQVTQQAPAAQTRVANTQPSAINKNTKVEPDTPPIIKGIVIGSEYNGPMSYTEVIINGIDTVVTDTAGKFSIIIPDKLRDKKLKLTVEDYYYHKATKNIAAGTYPTDLKIILHRNNKRRIMGKF